MLPTALNFLGLLLLFGLAIRLVETKYPETTVGKALLFIY